MPRKKDGLLFDLNPRPTKGEDGRPLLYARPAVKRTWSTDYLDEYCNKYRNMSLGELTRALGVLAEVGAQLMEDGSRIETPLGTFGVRLKLDGDHTDPDKVTGKHVSFAGIDFIPSKRFVQELSHRMEQGFRKNVDPSKRETVADDAQRLQILRDISRARGYTTIKAFAYHCGIKYATARQWLNAHSEGEAPWLRAYREGHQMHYEPIEPERPEERY